MELGEGKLHDARDRVAERERVGEQSECMRLLREAQKERSGVDVTVASSGDSRNCRLVRVNRRSVVLEADRKWARPAEVVFVAFTSWATR